MGVCVHKDQKLVDARSKSELRETRNPTQRQRLSVLSVTQDENKQDSVMEVFNRQSKGHFQRTITSSEPKEEQGTVMLFGHKLVIQGISVTQAQNGFEDKKLSITGETIGEDVLARSGIAFTCKKGLKPESPNQDDFCVVVEGDTIMLGVFDGHGPFGHEISNFVHALLPKLITSSESLLESQPCEVIRSAFEKAHEHLLVHCEHPDTAYDCLISGSTASIAVFRKRKMIIAHVGDSRVVLGRRSGEAITAVAMTQDHKPTLPEEKARIEQRGGEVKQLPYDIPFRVFIKDKDYPGLSMSRAIGDAVAHDLGVTSHPDVLEIELTDDDEFLVLCSDGVWEFISSEEAVELVSKYVKAHAKQAAEKLAQLAWTRWLQHEDEVVDDITVIVAYIPKLLM